MERKLVLFSLLKRFKIAFCVDYNTGIVLKSKISCFADLSSSDLTCIGMVIQITCLKKTGKVRCAISNRSQILH